MNAMDEIPYEENSFYIFDRNNISWAKKFELDVYYVDHIGPKMDVKVFFTTIKKVLGREDINTTTGQSATMDYFDGTN